MTNSNLPTYTDYDSILHAFQIAATCHKNKPFIHYQLPNSLEFKTLTYEQVDNITTYLSNVWRPIILPPPEMINDNKTYDILQEQPRCIASLGHESTIQSILLFFTIMKLGLSYLPISMWCDVKATHHLLEQCDVSFIIATELYFKTTLNSADIMTVDDANIPVKVWKDYDIEELITLATLPTATIGVTENTNKIAVSKSQQRPSNLTAIFLVTGGSSTGLPKAIPYSHRAFLFNLTELSIKHDDQLNPFLAFEEQRESMFMMSSDTWLLASPAERMSTFYFLLWSMLLGASTLVFHHNPPIGVHEILMAAETYNPPWTYMTPNILELIAACLQENDSKEKEIMANVLRGFKVCMTGGAPVRTSTAKYLKSQGLNLRSGYGASEFGSLCTSFQNKSSGYHTYKFSRLSLPYLYFEPFDQDIYHLVIRNNYPGLANNIGNRLNGDFETRDLFTMNHDDHEQQNEQKSWTLIGRISDTFIIANGKRVYSALMESEICNEDIIQNCIVVGENKKCPALLVELKHNKTIEKQYYSADMVTKVYKAVERANKRVPNHSVILVPNMVYILPPDVQLPLTDKGSVFRKGVNSIFDDEIKQLYDEYDNDCIVEELSININC